MADAPRVVLGRGPGGGVHWVYRDNGVLIVEWYDHGEGAPYESASTLAFDADQERALLAAMQVAIPAGDAGVLQAIAAHFTSYFAVRQFATDHALAFTANVNCWP